MASYFDIKPDPQRTAPEIDDLPYDGDSNNGFSAFPRDSLLSPQVSRILDDLEGHSSSDESDTASDSGEQPAEGESVVASNEKTPVIESLHATKTSSSSSVGKEKDQDKPQDHRFPRVKRHPRLERFVSLRSSLLSSHLADNMSKCEEQSGGAQGASEHERVQASNSPMQPPKTHRKGSLTQRMGQTLRKLTGSNVPTLKGIKEGVETPASGKNADTAQPSGKRDSGHASDDSELARWKSGEDPPSDDSTGATRAGTENTDTSGSRHERHQSLGDEDVDDLVKWVSRRSSGGRTKMKPSIDDNPEPTRVGTKDAQASRSKDARHKSIQAEDVDDLVKWVSTKSASGEQNTPKAPDTNSPEESTDITTESDSNNGNDKPGKEIQDTDIDDIVRWISNNRRINADYQDAKEGKATSSLQQSKSHDSASSSHKNTSAAAHVLRREAPKGADRPLSEMSIATQEDRASSLAEDDVPELIRTITRDESTHDDEKKREAAILRWKIEKERQAKTGVVDKQHQGDLTEEDIDELVKWVSRRASVGGAAQ